MEIIMEFNGTAWRVAIMHHSQEFFAHHEDAKKYFDQLCDKHNAGIIKIIAKGEK